MRIIARATLRAYCDSLAGSGDQHAVEAALAAWIAEVTQAQWTSSADIKALYRHVSIISAERVVFNIKGNAHRLVVSVDYARGIVYIKWIGTHRAYDRINVLEVQHDG